MTKRLASKHKVDRRLKVNLWGRPKSPFNTRNYPPGQHGKTKRGKTSDYGKQLEAKQKMKFYYGNMNERQFRNVYRKAIDKKGFLQPGHKRSSMIRNINNIFHRINLSDQEIRILLGIFSTLNEFNKKS
jgi:ribosomal protein S4